MDPIKTPLINKSFRSCVSRKERRKYRPVKRKNMLGVWLLPYTDMPRKMGETENRIELKNAARRPNSLLETAYKAGMAKELKTTLIKLTANTGSFCEKIRETKIKSAPKRTVKGYPEPN